MFTISDIFSHKIIKEIMLQKDLNLNNYNGQTNQKNF